MNTRNRLLTAGLFACAALCSSLPAVADILVKMPGIPGDTMGPDGEDGWFMAKSFSFGVEREMKESGEKGGTQDINIGVGELQECTISKSMDWASAQLAQFAINGNSPGDCEICFTHQADAQARPICYLKYKLERAFISSWSISGDADDRPTEEVALYFTKIAMGQSVQTPDGRMQTDDMSWDRWKRKYWDEGAQDVLGDVGGTPPPPAPQQCPGP